MIEEKLFKRIIAILFTAVLIVSGCGEIETAKTKVSDNTGLATEEATLGVVIPDIPKKIWAPTDAPTEKAEDPSTEEATTEEHTTEELTTEEPTTEAPTEPPISNEEGFKVLENPGKYSYKELESDVKKLCSLYPDIASYESLGTTVDGREIYHIIVGDPEAEHTILITAGIHGREYITAQVAMKQCVALVKNINENSSYKGTSYSSLLNNCAVHFIPMVNPDGISISMYGTSGLNDSSLKKNLRLAADNDGSSLNSSYLERWKANANGVDINRNFDGAWYEAENVRNYVSYAEFKGYEPVSEVETKALVNITLKYMFDYIINYHTQGGEIYWYYNETGDALKAVERLRDAIKNVTGYNTSKSHTASRNTGTYRDWTSGDLKIKSITVEMGKDYSPVSSSQFPEIWRRCKSITEEVLLLLK